MRDLVELTGIFNKIKLKGNNAVQFIIDSDSKMNQLFQGLMDKKILSDEDAKLVLNEEGPRLANLKNKLKDRLLDASFLLDFKEANYTSRQKAFIECYKKWSIAMTLLVRNAKITGIDMLERLLRHSIRFEFTELSLDILRVLKLQYSTIDGDEKKYRECKVLYQEYETIWRMESKAEEYYSDLMIHYTNSKTTHTEHSEIAAKYYEELAPFMETCASFKLHLFGRLIQMMIYNTVNDYASTAKLCESAIAFFDQKDYDSGLPLQVFYYNLLICYLQLKEFDKGQKIIGRIAYFTEEGTHNWFKFQEIFFLLAAHTGHYEEAFELCDRILKYPRFSEKSAQTVEMWKIYEAYMQFLVKIGKISEQTAALNPNKFKIGKFLNEMELYSKDKKGMNSSILIIQILFSIAERQYDQCIDQIERVEKYCTRYLKGSETFRINMFIRMLLQIPINNFHREAVRRKSEKHFKQLQSKPLESAYQAHEIEIVPFEALWEMTLETLELKIFKPRK